MKFTGIITRSLQADMQVELRDLERAVSGGTREAGRGLKSELRRHVDEGHYAARDAAFDALLQPIGVALDADPTLNGRAFGLTYGRPETSIEAVAGAPAIKAATLIVTVDYETATLLA
jgi:hypothetical protein